MAVHCFNSFDKLDDMFVWPEPRTKPWYDIVGVTIGGSNVESFLDKSRYKNKYQLFLEKIGMMSNSMNEPCAWGLMMEEFTQMYVECIWGRELFVPGTLFRPPLSYTADGIIMPSNDKETPILVEIKTPYYRKIVSSGGMPLFGYLLQVLQGLYLLREHVPKAMFYEAFYIPVMDTYNNKFLYNSLIVPATRKYDLNKLTPIMLALSVYELVPCRDTDSLKEIVINNTHGSLNLALCDHMTFFTVIMCLLRLPHLWTRQLQAYVKRVDDNNADAAIVEYYTRWNENNKDKLRYSAVMLDVFEKELHPDHDSVQAYIEDAQSFCNAGNLLARLSPDERREIIMKHQKKSMDDTFISDVLTDDVQ